MKKLKLFFACLLMAVLSIGQVWGADPSVKSTFSTSSTVTDNKVTENGVTWTLTTSGAVGSPTISTGTASSTQGLKFGSSSTNYFGTIKFSTDYFKNYNVKSVTIYEKNNGSKKGTLTVTQGSVTIGTATHSANTSSWATLTASGTTGEGGTLEVTYQVAQASYFNYIEVVYEEGGTTCTSEITITKAEDPANGTFAIDNSGTVCIDEGKATVNVTATPNTGYHLETVTSTVGTVGDIDGNTCAITNIGANTTISVTFAANPKYTVSFNVGGSTASQADITETSAGAGIELPAGPTPTCSADGWVFAGWKETSAVDVETTAAPTLLLAGANYKPAANCTLYAVYKRTESGDVEDQDVTETFENQEAGTNYQTTLTYTAENSNAGIAWEMYYGTVSTNDKIADNKSAQMRLYYNHTDAYGYIRTTSAISGLQSIDFKARVSSTDIKMSVWYSTDGTNWTAVDENLTFSATGTGLPFSSTINGTVGTNYYIKIGVGSDAAFPSSGNTKLIIDNIKFNFKAPASTTYYLSAPTCAAPTCEDLGTPSVTVTNKTYNSAKLTWAAVDNADKYLVIFNGVDQEATENLYFDATGLEAEETYTYQVKALAEEGQDDYCDGDFSTEASFTTEEAPAATLTLSERGTTHPYPGSHKVGDVVSLPDEAEECSKTFVGWSANASCAVAPEYAPGASYTLAAVSQTLYAVYATPSGSSTWEEIFAVPVAGDYAIYSDGHLMEAAISSNRFQNAAASVTDGKLDDAPAASCIWTVSINASDYFQFKNGTKYASSTSSNNQGALTEDATDTKAQWTIAYSEGFTIENVGRKAAAGNYTLRNNGDYGWGSYGASTGTAPRLFKKMVTYTDFSTSCTAALAKPQFSEDPEDGPFDHELSIELTAAEGTIYYNINSVDDPTSESTEYDGAITVDACGSTIIKAIAISSTNQSAVASATYVLDMDIPSVSAEDPYTEAEAVQVYNSGCYDDEDVWVTGTVKTAQFYNSNTYTITLTNDFQFYYFYESFDGENLVPFSEDYIEAGDVLVAKGKLGKHNTTYQIANGYLVSRTPAPKTPIDSDIDNPISVAAAINYIDNAATYDLSEDEFVAGIVESIAECPQHEGTYDIIVLDATDNTKQMKFFGCDVKTFAGIKQYDQITGKGKLDKYYSTYELNYPCEVVALTPYVAPVVDVTGVEVDETAIVKVGKTVQLTANVLPANASNKNVTWSVKAGSEAYAEVSATGVVTGKAEGEAIIVVTTEEGNFSDECTVTVTGGINFAAGDFVLVEDAAELTEGTYVIVAGAGENNVAMKYHAGNSDGNHKGKAAVKEGKYLHYDADFGVYEIKNYEVNEEVVGISFYNENAENYFSLPGNSNQLKTSDEQNANSSWTAAVSEGVTTLTNKALTTRTLRYNPNNGSPVFACYTTGQQPIAIYKYVTPAVYRVYYNDNVAEEEIDVPAYQSVDGENKVTITAVVPVRDGFLFGGWKDGENNVYEAGVEYTLSGDITLYAQWNTATVSTLSYNPNGGTLIDGETAIADAEVAEGANLTIEANVYEKGDNYVFAGWQLGEEVYQPGDAFVMPATDVEFVAKWDEIEVSDFTLVTNLAQLQAGDKIIIVAATLDFAAGAQAATYRESVAIGKTASKNNLILAGYDAPTEFTLGISEDKYSFNDGDGYMYENSEKSVKVQDEPYYWTISIDADAIATITGTNPLLYNSNSGQERFTTYTSSQKALQLYRKPGVAPTPTYTVTYDLNGGQGTAPTQDAVEANTVITLANTTGITAPEGKEFDGWLCDIDAAKYNAGANYTMTAANTTFTAQWKDATPAPATYVAKIGETKYESLPAAVAAAEDGQTVELLMDVAAGPGVMITSAEHKQIIIDFGNHTYCAKSPAVGSAGTQNQAFHFEKGCNITLQNGTITSSGNEIIMLIQNYGDLTLMNITLIGNNLPGTHRYVLSNNCGNVVIGDGTTITAKEGDVAFDVCVTNYYPEGTQVTVEDNATITGIVEYDVWGTIPADNKATLTIEDGSFNITWNVEPALAEDAKDNINVSGGTFNAEVPADYCAHGFIPKDNGNGQYGVHYAGYYERGSLTPGNYATICLPRAGKISGASLFDIEYYENSTLYLLEVEGNTMVAGRPYIFLPSVEKIEVIYTDAVDATAGSFNGLVGSLSLDAEVIPANEGNYILSNNQYWYVNSLAYVGANRAYIHMASVPTEPSTPQVGQAPRRRVSMNVNNEQVATGMDALNASDAPVKVMINGQLFILRGEKMFDATGRLVK